MIADEIDKQLYGEDVRKIFRPQSDNSGRLRVKIYKIGNDARSMSFPKYLMERHLKRLLLNTENVHHIDGNYRNNVIENLEVKDIVEHGKFHNKHTGIEMPCDFCNKIFKKRPCRMQGGKKNYCSRFCSIAGYRKDQQNAININA